MNTEHNDSPGATPLTPPPATESAALAQESDSLAAPPAGKSGATTAIMTVTAIIGGIALLVTGGTAAVAATGTLFYADGPDSVQSVPVDGIEGIELSVDAGDVRVEFGDVPDAELAITNTRRPQWRFERDGDELIVRSSEFRWDWWFGGWFGDGERAVLTLPESLRDAHLEADVTLNAGELDISGDFGDLDIEVNAGQLGIDGSATSVAVDLNAGGADIQVERAREADLTVAAGTLSVELTGTVPTQTRIDVSAGSLDLTVPDARYAVTDEVSAGTLDVGVEESSNARNTIDVTLTAGTVTISPGG